MIETIILMGLAFYAGYHFGFDDAKEQAVNVFEAHFKDRIWLPVDEGVWSRGRGGSNLYGGSQGHRPWGV